MEILRGLALMKSKLEGLYHHQKHAAHIISFKDKFTHAQPLLHDMKGLKTFQINLFPIIYFMFKCKEMIATPIFHSLFAPKSERSCTKLKRTITNRTIL